MTILTEHWDVPCPLSKTSKQQFFLTSSMVYSLELNAHTWLYLALLVIQGYLPKEVLNIDRFNSQSCESTYRMARSMSGPFSNIVNFTVPQFLDRAEKLLALDSIKLENVRQVIPIQSDFLNTINMLVHPVLKLLLKFHRWPSLRLKLWSRKHSMTSVLSWKQLE